MSWKFAVITDTHSNESKSLADDPLENMVTSIVAQSPDLVLHLGDAVVGNSVYAQDSGPQTLYHQLQSALFPHMKTLIDAGIDVYPIRGNHDACACGFNTEDNDAEEDRRGWINAWRDFGVYPPLTGPRGEYLLTYNFGHNNAEFFMLDQYIQGIDPPCIGDTPYPYDYFNDVWLRRKLKSSTATHKFVCGHMPFFRVDDFTHYWDITENNVPKRNRVWRMMTKYNVDAYLCGHYHVFNLMNITHAYQSHSIYQIMSGSGAPYDLGRTYPYTGSKNDPYTDTVIAEEHETSTGDYYAIGYTLFEIDGDSVTVTWMDGAWSGSAWSFTATGTPTTWDITTR